MYRNDVRTLVSKSLMVVVTVALAGCALAACAPSASDGGAAAPARSSSSSPSVTEEPAEEAQAPLSGQVYVWGSTPGILAPVGVSTAPAPVPVPGMDDVVSAAAAADAIGVVRADGTAWWWGDLENGFGLVSAPMQIGEVADAVKIVPGFTTGSFQILTRSGAVYFFGNEGQFADGGATGERGGTDGVLLSGLPKAAQLASNTVLGSDGSVWVWGCQRSRTIAGYLDGTDPDACISFTQLGNSELEDVVSISGANAVLSDGRVWSFATGDYEQGVTGAESTVSTWENRYFNLGNGTVVAKGNNAHGGLGVLGDGVGPVTVPGLSKITSADTGYAGGTVATTSDGRAWVWGTGAATYPASLSPAADNAPVPIPDITGAIAAGDGFVLVSSPRN